MSNPIDQIDAMLALCARATGGKWIQDCTPTGPHGQKIYRNAVLSAEYPNNAICHRINPADDGYDKGQSFADMAFIAASRTGWEATLRALKVAAVAIENHPNRNVGDDGWMWERDTLAKIAKELEATQ